MHQCQTCEKPYRTYDEDAGTFKEHFCSWQCARTGENYTEAVAELLELRREKELTDYIIVILAGYLVTRSWTASIARELWIDKATKEAKELMNDGN